MQPLCATTQRRSTPPCKHWPSQLWPQALFQLPPLPCSHTLFFSLLFFLVFLHMGSWFPDQGSNLCPPYWKHGVLTTGPPGKSQIHIIVRNLGYFQVWVLLSKVAVITLMHLIFFLQIISRVAFVPTSMLLFKTLSHISQHNFWNPGMQNIFRDIFYPLLSILEQIP